MVKKTTKKPKDPTPQVDGELTRCPNCGSTDREPYFGTTVQEYGGITPDGQPHTHIVRRRTVCRGCRQCRVDRFYENRADAPESPAKDGADE